MSLRLYTGEYLVSPYVLHFGLNWCTHACWYCFANANKPDRAAEQSDLARLVRWYDVGSDCAEFRLLKAGHPIMTANDSDPCAKSNAPTFAILHGLSQKYDFRLVYQTRGGEPEAERAIVDGASTSVYISLTTDDDALGRKMEPGAPLLAQRMDFIRRLRARGHHVIVGLNPYVPDWWEDVGATLAKLADMGVFHVWHQPLLLSRFQVANLRPSAKRDYGDWIKYGMARVEPDQAGYADMLAACADAGMNTIRLGVSDKLGFWDDYFALGFPFVPTMDALVRDCHAASDGRPAVFGIDAFARWAEFGMKPGSKCKEYLVGIGRSVRNAGERVEDAKDMRGVHEFLWRREDYPTRFRHSAFARAAHGDGWASDGNGIPLMVVSADGFAEDWAEVDASECVYLNDIRRK